MYSGSKSDKTVKYSEKIKGVLIPKKYLPGAPKEVSKYAIMPSIKQAIGEAMHEHERAVEHQMHAEHGH